MKKITTVFFILFLLTICSKADEKQKAKDAFRRYFKMAHPLPDANIKTKPQSILLSNGSSLPNFLNVNVTFDEDESEAEKMQNESSISVNPTNPSNLIASAVDYRAHSSTWIYVSDDEGRTWRNINLGKPYPNWRSTNDPSVMFDNDGVGYLCYGGFGDVNSTNAGLVGENGVFIAKTTDEGKTWKAHIPVIIHLGEQTLDSNFEDKYYIQTDNSPSSPYYRHAYIPWKRVTPRDSSTQIVFSKSEDLGETWSEPINLSHRISGSSEDTTFGQSFALCTTGPKGEVYVVWNNGLQHSVDFVKSYDGGKTFTEPKTIQQYNIFGETKFLAGQGFRHVVKGGVRAEAYPVVVADISDSERRGNLYVSWSADNYPNVYFSKSTDEGDTWSEPVIIHSDTTNDQFWQWLSLDPKNGDLGIMFLDSRNDEQNLMVECYVAYSSDGGDTWIDRRVSDISSDLRLNPFQGGAFAGDYNGNAFFNGKIFPSWVDMRNAVTNISDSDVMTALVNVRAPEPPNDFESDSDLKSPTEIDLSWIPPTKRAFGQPLKPEEFIHRLTRDGKVIATLDGDKDKFVDEDIIPFQKYEYTIYAVADTDSSMAREITAYAGGSDKPDAPEILALKGDFDENVELTIKIPSFRSDKITPLVNAQGVKINQLNFDATEHSISPSDTGRTMNFTVKADKIGFQKFRASIFDYFEILDKNTESDFTEYYDVFTGSSLEFLSEEFEELPLPYYDISDNWEVTDEASVSGIHSISNAPYTQYKGRQNDTLTFLPVTMENNEDLYITFMQICAVSPEDSALIEISYDDMATWEILAQFSNADYEEWKNEKISNSLWRFKRLTIPYKATANRVFTRLRFQSNTLRNSYGWYLDDIVIGKKAVSVDNSIEKQIKLFPNPSSDFVNIVSDNKLINRIRIFDLQGNLMTNYFANNSNQATLDLSDLFAGSYFAEIYFDDGTFMKKLLFLTK